MERGLLSDPELGAFYDDVVWMYLFQDFSHSEADREAERVAIRFGITSWPQHFLVDPRTLEVVADTGRSLESFGRAVAGVTVAEGPGIRTADLAAADRLAAQLEGEVGIADAKRYLDHDDVVVRYRAIQRLATDAPDAIAAAADALLRVPHDQTRFLVCEVLARSGDARANDRLEELVRDPAGSRNPNVLRIRAVQALGSCGDVDSVAVIAPFAGSGAYFNGLTGVAVDALVGIDRREADAGPAVRVALVAGFPVPDPKADERERRACTALARRVHDALQAVTGEQRPFPPVYDPAARARLIELWQP